VQFVIVAIHMMMGNVGVSTLEVMVNEFQLLECDCR